MKAWTCDRGWRCVAPTRSQKPRCRRRYCCPELLNLVRCRQTGSQLPPSYTQRRLELTRQLHTPPLIAPHHKLLLFPPQSRRTSCSAVSVERGNAVKPENLHKFYKIRQEIISAQLLAAHLLLIFPSIHPQHNLLLHPYDFRKCHYAILLANAVSRNNFCITLKMTDWEEIVLFSYIYIGGDFIYTQF